MTIEDNSIVMDVEEALNLITKLSQAISASGRFIGYRAEFSEFSVPIVEKKSDKFYPSKFNFTVTK